MLLMGELTLMKRIPGSLCNLHMRCAFSPFKSHGLEGEVVRTTPVERLAPDLPPAALAQSSSSVIKGAKHAAGF